MEWASLQVEQRAGPARVSVLCVDDDTYLTDLLRYALTRAGYAVQIASTGSDALQCARSNPPDVAIVDVNLPELDGFAVCSAIRRDLHIPVILLTARHLEVDEIAGFEHGADDYITKPFNMQILLARLQAVLAREQAPAVGDKKHRLYRLGTALFNAEYNQLLAGTRTIQLTPTEGRMLGVLLSHEGQVFSADHLVELVRGYDCDTNPAVVKTHILHLRAKIADAIGDAQVIRTVPGVGYTYRRAPQPAGRVSA